MTALEAFEEDDVPPGTRQVIGGGRAHSSGPDDHDLSAHESRFALLDGVLRRIAQGLHVVLELIAGLAADQAT